MNGNDQNANSIPENIDNIFIIDIESGEIKMRFTRGGIARGSICGFIDKKGYRRIKIRGTAYYAHRIIWKKATGEDPNEIDHKNGIKDDNRIENLRSVTRKEQVLNSKKINTNTGYKGITYRPERQKQFCAKVSRDGKTAWKSFYSLKEAKEFVTKTRNIMHGEFANHE